tara:strand:+ start:379 stop:570 length:192 start_codon:yes stop_codon:yes gene_type:complete
MLETIKQKNLRLQKEKIKKSLNDIRNLATATENIYLLHLVKKLKKQIKKQNELLTKQEINFGF